MNELRIGIAGCAGTGKSLLGEKLSVATGLPFLPAKNITGKILQRDGYDYASGQSVENFLGTPAHQQEILEATIEQHSVEVFITDRTAIDIAAYAILELRDGHDVKRHLARCRELSERYTHIFFCPWRDCKISGNQRRTLNPWYQFSVYSVELNVAKMFEIKLKMLEDDDIDKRVEFITSWTPGIFETTGIFGNK